MTSSVGDAVYLSNYLVNTHVYGVVVPDGDPPEFWATYEIRGDQGPLFMAAVLGPDGEPGKDAFALKLQTDDKDHPDDLPLTMTNTPADIGIAGNHPAQKTGKNTGNRESHSQKTNSHLLFYFQSGFRILPVGILQGNSALRAAESKTMQNGREE